MTTTLATTAVGFTPKVSLQECKESLEKLQKKEKVKYCALAKLDFYLKMLGICPHKALGVFVVEDLKIECVSDYPYIKINGIYGTEFAKTKF